MGSADQTGRAVPHTRLRFCLLGPVQVLLDGRPVPLGGTGMRGLLAMLLLEPNQVVSLDRIVDVLWSHEPPESARTMVQGYVSRLRQRLSAADPAGSVRIVTNPPGYQLLVDESLIDVTVARKLVNDSWGAPAVRRAELLRAAQSLWRGPELADLGGRVSAPELAELRLTVLEGRIEADLELGRHNEVIGELTQLVEEQPFRERLVGQLLLALYRSGRRTAALGAYQRFAQLAASHSGIEPGPELRALHARVLRDDTTLLDPQAESVLSPRIGVIVPAQLPIAPSGFSGRDRELDWLDKFLSGQDRNLTSVGVIAGPAGIGKTALVVRWANQVAEKFSDGQLFASMRGFDPQHAPAEPADVLAQFLLSLGVRPDDIPMNLDDRAALYRSLLAERRVLVVLDDAKDSEQVRPLLPGGSSSLVLITSRIRLAGLVAGLAARLWVLGTLGANAAERLLEETAGLPNGDHDRMLRRRLAELCGHLPLALRIIAARLAARPLWSLDDLVEELVDERTRLSALNVEGTDTSVRAALDVTYRALRPTLAATFRMVGLFPGPRLSPYSVAALCGTDVTDARKQLWALAASFVVTETSKDVFVLHDLVRIYAAELASIEVTQADRSAALRRLLRYYLVTSGLAREWLNPVQRDHNGLDIPGYPEVHRPSLQSVQDAAGWLELEWDNLVAVAEVGGTAGAQEDLVRLGRIVSDFSSGSRGLTGPLLWSAGVALVGRLANS